VTNNNGSEILQRSEVSLDTERHPPSLRPCDTFKLLLGVGMHHLKKTSTKKTVLLCLSRNQRQRKQAAIHHSRWRSSSYLE